MTRQKVIGELAPSVDAASSSAGSSSMSTGSTARTGNGSVTNARASTIAGAANAILIPAPPSAAPIAVCGPSSATSAIPATSVGIASGRSTSADSAPRPGNL